MNPLQVTFHYVGYNESGRRIDSSYMQGSPAKIRMGTNALVPGKYELQYSPVLSLLMVVEVFSITQHKVKGVSS